MKYSLLLPAAVLLVLTQPAWAEPAWGSNCLACHGVLQPGLIAIMGEDGTADPDESVTGAPDRGLLPVFQVYPGNSKSLQAALVGLNEGDRYSVELKRLRFSGVETGSTLLFSPDCDWPEWGDSPYYTQPEVGYCWGEGPTTFTYTIGTDGEGAFDYFDLVFAVAGKFADTGELFYAEEHFYLQLTWLRGDINCDGSVNVFDIDPFVQALTDPAGFLGALPGCTIENADINRDGSVDVFDIDPFVLLLTGG
ncbi:MAG: dockerin type I repeat-containing protein [Phycisphaerae bacterium]|jgi:hypothetical protein|nr:dockerin type I repeat-containing protein [Phycisphaerae bacterium]HOO15815.1 dockerin type I repeat-containing protein [Phycisphaerae bacterium]HPC21407.1 dockerin type I repeat-containing protein [Phycisphaerae bacterium]HRS27180.1 dockerin type I repeat-containing protein [Phycisphaerae bacterium]HRT41018.1 dockerin type I repeat-containing protein [Phycisphaerae bacterium]